MSAGVGRSIAEAIVTDSNSAKWSQAVAFERRYVPREDLENLTKPVVSVVYAMQRAVPDNRADWRHEYDIDIGVQHRAPTELPHDLDPWTDLLDEIGDYWKTRKPGATGAVLQGVEWVSPYVPEHLTNLKVFTGVLRLTFRLVRSNT